MSATVIIDKNGRLEAIVLGKDDTLHLVRAEGGESTGEAMLFYDEKRDKPVRGYGRAGLCTYGPEFAFSDGLISCRETTPAQPEAST